jgi:hypothetical protein
VLYYLYAGTPLLIPSMHNGPDATDASHLNCAVVARRLLGKNHVTIFSRRGRVRLLKDLEIETTLSLDALDVYFP